jgi:hypothetical protein
MDSSGYRPSVNVEDRRNDPGIERYRQSIAAQLRNPNLHWQTRERFENFLRDTQAYDPVAGTGGFREYPTVPHDPERDRPAYADRKYGPLDEMPAEMEPGVHYVPRERLAEMATQEAADLRFNEEMSRLITPRMLAEELMRR